MENIIEYIKQKLIENGRTVYEIENGIFLKFQGESKDDIYIIITTVNKSTVCLRTEIVDIMPSQFNSALNVANRLNDKYTTLKCVAEEKSIACSMFFIVDDLKDIMKTVEHSINMLALIVDSEYVNVVSSL